MDDIEKQVRDFIVENYLFGAEEDAPAPEASFLELQLIDSTGVLELVQFLESTFNIQIADEELIPENLDSIRKIGEFVGGKTGGAV
jgi:acyl carrier protein